MFEKQTVREQTTTTTVLNTTFGGTTDAQSTFSDLNVFVLSPTPSRDMQ